MGIYWLQHDCKDKNYGYLMSHNQAQQLLMMRLGQDFETRPGKGNLRDIHGFIIGDID